MSWIFLKAEGAEIIEQNKVCASAPFTSLRGFYWEQDDQKQQ